jgi:hypothetical protein
MDWYVSHRNTTTMMIDDQLARAHRNNIQRYRSLLQTNLTEFIVLLEQDGSVALPSGIEPLFRP